MQTHQRDGQHDGEIQLHPETPELNGYLEDTAVIDWQTARVFEKGRELCQGVDGDVAVARRLFEWVRDEISHSSDVESSVLTCTAGQVLKEGTGLCFAKSHLLAALLRRAGIPAGFVYQRLRRDPPRSGHVLHGLCGVYLKSLDRWVALDPRGDNDVISTEFSVDRPSLAWVPDPDEGEETYPTVFTRPVKRVLDVLQRAPTREKALDHLPDSLR